MLLHAGVFLMYWVRSIDAERSKLVLSVCYSDIVNCYLYILKAIMGYGKWVYLVTHLNSVQVTGVLYCHPCKIECVSCIDHESLSFDMINYLRGYLTIYSTCLRVVTHFHVPADLLYVYILPG